jgi:hypothetical protein
MMGKIKISWRLWIVKRIIAMEYNLNIIRRDKWCNEDGIQLNWMRVIWYDQYEYNKIE